MHFRLILLVAATLWLLGTMADAQIAGILAPVIAPAPRPAAGSAPNSLPASPQIDSPALCDLLARSLTDRLSLTGGELTLAPVSLWVPVAAPNDHWSVTLLEAPDLKGLTSHFYLRFRLAAGDVPLGEWQIPFHAQWTREVWVATRRLVRGEKPDLAADLEPRRLNVLAERQAPIAAQTPLDGYELAETVAAGQPLTWHNLSARTAVHRGQAVTVIAGDGPFSIAMKALAIQDGALGATVRVRNLTSLRDLEARVIGEGKVQVSF